MNQEEQNNRISTLMSELASITPEQLELFTADCWSDWDTAMDAIEYMVQEVKDYET